MTTTTTAIIVGNGTSRQGISLEDIRALNLGPIFGCNALYRDFEPDYLVAIDPVIVAEIKQHFDLDKFIETPYDKQFEPAAFNPRRPRQNAGMVAMEAAINMGFRRLYLMGMDFMIHDPALNMGNLYDNTNGYGPETRASYEDTIARSRFFLWFCQQHPNIEFVLLYPDGNYNVRGIVPNLKYKAYEEFLTDAPDGDHTHR